MPLQALDYPLFAAAAAAAARQARDATRPRGVNVAVAAQVPGSVLQRPAVVATTNRCPAPAHFSSSSNGSR